MVGNRNKLVYTTILAFLLVLPFALGVNILDQVLRPFEGTNFGEVYLKYAPFIDGIIYFWLFIGIARGALGKVFPENKAIPTAMGVILAIGMTVFEYNTKFNLGRLGWLSALILFTMFGVAIYKTIKTGIGDEADGSTLTAFSFSFILWYALVKSVSPELITQIENIDLIGAIIGIAFLISIIGLVTGAIKLVGSIKTGAIGLGRSEVQAEKAGNVYKNEEERENNNIVQEQNAAGKIANLNSGIESLNEALKHASELESNLYNVDLRNRNEQIKVLSEIENLTSQSWKLQTELQGIIANFSKPEYQNNPQYENVVQTTSKQLSDLISRINSLLGKLSQGIANTKDNQIKEDQAEKELKDKIINLQKSITQCDEAILFLKQKITEKQSSKGKRSIEEQNALNALQQMMEDRKQLFLQLQSSNEKLRLTREKITANDNANKLDLDNLMKTGLKNPTEELKLAKKTKDILDTWYKYLQSGALKNIYTVIQTIHSRIQQYASIYGKEERDAIIERNELLKKIIASHSNSNKLLDIAIQKQIQYIKQEIDYKKSFIEEFGMHLKAWTSALEKIDPTKTINENTALINGLPANPTKYNNKTKLSEQLEFYGQVFENITETSLKEFLKTKNKELRTIIDLLKGKNLKKEDVNRKIEAIQKDIQSEFERITLQLKNLQEFYRIENAIRQESQLAQTTIPNAKQNVPKTN